VSVVRPVREEKGVERRWRGREREGGVRRRGRRSSECRTRIALGALRSGRRGCGFDVVGGGVACDAM
jgi:hypothetical protein